MKKLFVVMSLVMSFGAYADIEYSADQDSKPTIIEINKNRACFEEVAKLGCGDPGEDPKHFKSCLKDIHSSLSTSCKKMMSDLYSVK